MTHVDSTIISRDVESVRSALGIAPGARCVLWDVPYYSNVGDVLIWQGTEDLLKVLGIKCIGRASKETCTFPRLDSDVVILLLGGGNFGGLYPEHQNFRRKVWEHYPDNRIIQLPQSVAYTSAGEITKDAELLAKCPNVTICLRDKRSIEAVNRYFPGVDARLVRDFAQFASIDKLKRYAKPEQKKTLLLKRADAEAVNTDCNVRADFCGDWPPMERRSLAIRLLDTLTYKCRTWQSSPLLRFVQVATDIYAGKVMRPMLLREGVRFVSPYSTVVSTRLHGMVMALMLGKDTSYIDNSTHKISAYAETWQKT